MPVQESPNLGLSYGWEEGESGWGGPVNRNWLLLDVTINPIAISASRRLPPDSPKEGDRYVVPADAEGPWEMHRGMVACFIGGGWRYFVPKRGWIQRIIDVGVTVMHDGVEWQFYQSDPFHPHEPTRIEELNLGFDPVLLLENKMV